MICLGPLLGTIRAAMWKGPAALSARSFTHRSNNQTSRVNNLGISSLKMYKEPGVMLHTCNPRTEEAAMSLRPDWDTYWQKATASKQNNKNCIVSFCIVQAPP